MRDFGGRVAGALRFERFGPSSVLRLATVSFDQSPSNMRQTMSPG
jgi:hypothetical protein